MNLEYETADNLHTVFQILYFPQQFFSLYVESSWSPTSAQIPNKLNHNYSLTKLHYYEVMVALAVKQSIHSGNIVQCIIGCSFILIPFAHK